MDGVRIDRRSLTVFAGTLLAGLGAAARDAAADDLGISRAASSIHQEVVFKASPARVYQTLTEAARFDKVVRLSQAFKSMAPTDAPAQIESEPGGAFSLFGGYITGRQIELSPNVRIIQAWRSASWPPHIYSIAKFELADHPAGCKLMFDQTGFPDDQAEHLAAGWRENYWEPMAKAFV